MELKMWLTEGTRVVVLSDWGDDTFSMVSCVIASDMSVIIFNHTYQKTGNFTVRVSASNAANSHMVNQTISVYDRIQDLTLTGNDTVLTPPGTGTWQMVSNAVC